VQEVITLKSFLDPASLSSEDLHKCAADQIEKLRADTSYVGVLTGCLSRSYGHLDAVCTTAANQHFSRNQFQGYILKMVSSQKEALDQCLPGGVVTDQVIAMSKEFTHKVLKSLVDKAADSREVKAFKDLLPNWLLFMETFLQTVVSDVTSENLEKKVTALMGLTTYLEAVRVAESACVFMSISVQRAFGDLFNRYNKVRDFAQGAKMALKALARAARITQDNDTSEECIRECLGFLTDAQKLLDELPKAPFEEAVVDAFIVQVRIIAQPSRTFVNNVVSSSVEIDANSFKVGMS
jgi:hypothetical protein